jgi:hypothetical protein
MQESGEAPKTQACRLADFSICPLRLGIPPFVEDRRLPYRKKRMIPFD